MTVPALTAAKREMALAGSPAEKLVALKHELTPLAIAVAHGFADRQIVVDEIIAHADAIGLIDAIGEAPIAYAIADALDHLPDEQSSRSNGAATLKAAVTLDDFVAYMPTHNYIFKPTREMWPAGSVNSRIPPVPLLDDRGNAIMDKRGGPAKISASAWLDENQPVEQMTWCPGLPMLINDRLVSDGGWIERPGATCFNLYRPPTIKSGTATAATRWVDHVGKVFPDDADHIIKWLAHRVQCPAEKINHAIVLGGEQGIGKDTLLEPVKRAVGPWNFQEVSPQQMFGRFNGFLKSVILRLSEARDLGEVNRFQFYDHMKAYLAAPPDVLRIDEKHLREYAVFNCVGVIITTNHKADGIYLPADDRRHYVAWSPCKRQDFGDDYWRALWRWYADGGDTDVAAFLEGLDLSGFDPKTPPAKTAAFWDIVGANQAPENAELSDVLDRLGNPDVITIDMIAQNARPLGMDSMAPERGSFFEWLTDRRNRRVIPHRLEEAGYVPVRNADAGDGLWKIRGKRQVAYAKQTLSVSERTAAALQLARG